MFACQPAWQRLNGSPDIADSDGVAGDGPPERGSPRASDRDRERVCRQLREHFVEGRLRLPELEARLAAALTADTLADLSRLTDDLPELAPEVPAPAADAVDLTDPSLLSRDPAMAEVLVDGGTLVVRLRGLRRIGKIRKIRTPLAGVRSVRVEAHPVEFVRSIRRAGSPVPIRTRRTFSWRDPWQTFAIFRQGQPALVIEMSDGPYRHVIVHVKDPGHDTRVVRRAIAGIDR